MVLHLPDSAMKTYGIAVPKSEWRTATCQEVGCKSYSNGWSTSLLLGDNDFGDKSYYDIKRLGFKFTTEKLSDGFTRFTFEAGQSCFRGRAGAHRKRKENARDVFYVRDRDNLVRRNSGDWVDDFANHQITLSDALERG